MNDVLEFAYQKTLFSNVLIECCCKVFKYILQIEHEISWLCKFREITRFTYNTILLNYRDFLGQEITVGLSTVYSQFYIKYKRK